MRNDKNKALKLRLQGKSYNQINKALDVPKSTLSNWFINLELSKKAREKIKLRVYEKSIKGLIKRNKLQAHVAKQKARKIRGAAQKEINKLSKKELLLIGASLYWAEGYKKSIIRNGKIRTYHPVSMTNSDPNLIKMFLRFLREVCGVPESKITANLRIYEHQNENYLLGFWSKLTNIPYNKFSKSYYGISKSSLGKKPYNTLPYGTIQIRVNSGEVYHRIMGWIDALAKL